MRRGKEIFEMGKLSTVTREFVSGKVLSIVEVYSMQAIQQIRQVWNQKWSDGRLPMIGKMKDMMPGDLLLGASVLHCGFYKDTGKKIQRPIY